MFGALIARALDSWWDGLGAIDPFVVVDAGAGRGRLAADVLRASPRCRAALRYVLVERSPVLRTAQRELLALEPVEDALGPGARRDPEEPPVPVAGAGPIVTSLAELPAAPVDGVVLANELLDNLPFRIVERTAGHWQEVRVGLDAHDRFIEMLVSVPADLEPAADRVAPPNPTPGARLPVPTGLSDWFERVRDVLRHGYLLVIDYAAGSAELAERGPDGWLRTYRGHERGAPPLDAAGAQDITYDVPIEFLVETAGRAGFVLLDHTTQTEWLRRLGVEELTQAAADEWRERAPVGDLAAVAARSRVHEADALTDPAGLGAHHVFVFERNRRG